MTEAIVKTNPLFSFLSLFVLLLGVEAWAQPVPPSNQIQPKTTDIKTIPKVIPDLPYKPQEILVPSDVKGDEDSGSGEAKPLDWTKIPPLSSKGPSFKPADDPAYD